MFVSIGTRTSSKMGIVRLQLGHQVILKKKKKKEKEKRVRSTGHIFRLIVMNIGHNVCLNKILDSKNRFIPGQKLGH